MGLRWHDIHPPQFEEIERIGFEVADAWIDEMHHFIIPKGYDRRGIDHALVHLPIEAVACRIVVLLQGLFIEPVEAGVIITGIVRWCGVAGIKHA